MGEAKLHMVSGVSYRHQIGLFFLAYYFGQYVSWFHNLYYILGLHCRLGLRSYYFGLSGFYSMFWICNLALVLAGVGLMQRNFALVQVLWIGWFALVAFRIVFVFSFVL
jgi:hypothetical protein